MKFDTQKRRRFMGERQVVSPTLARALSLWCWYYETTEAFDQMACVQRDKDGIAMPVSPWEKSLCTRYARNQMDLIERDAHVFGIPRDEMTEARKKALSMKPKAREEWLNEVGGEPAPRLTF